MKLNVFGWVLRAVPLKGRGSDLGTCQECHWWNMQYSAPGETKGHCRRLAPMTDHNGRTLWPRTNHNQSCGQFRRREEGGEK